MQEERAQGMCAQVVGWYSWAGTRRGRDTQSRGCRVVQGEEVGRNS